MLYLRSLGLTHLTPEIKVYTLGPTSPCFPNPSTPGNHHCVLCFYEFNTFRFHLQEILQCLYFFTVFLQWVLMQSLGGNKICTIQRWGNGKAQNVLKSAVLECMSLPSIGATFQWSDFWLQMLAIFESRNLTNLPPSSFSSYQSKAKQSLNLRTLQLLRLRGKQKLTPMM